MLSGTEAVGPHRGRPVTRVVSCCVEQQGKEGPVLGQCKDFGVYADRVLDGRDRQRLFGMCRYLTRPAVSQARLTEMRDGRLHCRLKRVFRDGTGAVVLSPLDLIFRRGQLPAARSRGRSTWPSSFRRRYRHCGRATVRPRSLPGAGYAPRLAGAGSRIAAHLSRRADGIATGLGAGVAAGVGRRACVGR